MPPLIRRALTVGGLAASDFDFYKRNHAPARYTAYKATIPIGASRANGKSAHQGIDGAPRIGLWTGSPTRVFIFFVALTPL
jgi:hypothetical protein